MSLLLIIEESVAYFIIYKTCFKNYSPLTFGGFSYWVRGPENLDANVLQKIARKHSLLIEPGDVHFSGDKPPMNYFRLGYSSIKADNIEPGIKLLAKLIAELTN